MGKKKQRPLTEIFGWKFGTLPSASGLELVLLKRGQENTIVSSEPRMVDDNLEPIPILTRNSSHRRCPYCGRPPCLRTVFSKTEITIEANGKYYEFGLFLCNKEDKPFLKEVRYQEPYLRKISCWQCQSENLDIRDAYQLEVRAEAEIIDPGFAYVPRKAILIDYECLQCGFAIIMKLGIEEKRGFRFQDANYPGGKDYNSPDGGIVTIESELLREKMFYHIKRIKGSDLWVIGQ